MLSSLKKPSDKTSASTVPAWHPNFRNYERLPDTKVVRTTFFINGIAVLIATSLAIYVTYREVELDTIKSDTAIAQNIVDVNKPLSDQAVVLYNKFQDEEKKIQELKQFLDASRITVSDFLIKLGSNIPSAVKLSAVDYKGAAVILRGSIKGSSEEGTGFAIAYVDELRADEFYSKKFEPITLSSIVRDPETGQIRFEVELTFKSVEKIKKGGKK